MTSSPETPKKDPPPAEDPAIRKAPLEEPPTKEPPRRDPPQDPDAPTSVEDPRPEGQPERAQT